MKTIRPLVFMLVCLTCCGFQRSAAARITTEDQDVEGGRDEPEVEQPPPWTVEEEVAVEEETENLRELIILAIQRNRSLTHGHKIFPMSPRELVTSTQLTFLDLVHLYLPDVTLVSAKCQRDLIATYRAIASLDTLVARGELWPLLLVDSWGKFGDGLLMGNMKQLGFFKECLNIKVHQSSSGTQKPEKHQPQHLTLPLSALSRLLNTQPHSSIPDQDPKLYRPVDLLNSSIESRGVLPKADFIGQYCLVSYTSAEGPQDVPSRPRTPALPSLLPAALTLMQYGTCMPSTCTEDELQETVNKALQKEGLKVKILDCQTENQNRHPLQGPEITGIVLLLALVLLLASATCADVVTLGEKRQHLRQGPLRYLLAFSVTTNLPKIMHMETRKLPGVIPSINGIRFLSISWVVMGHQCAYSVSASQNIADLPELSKPVSIQIVTNADLSVDTFFMLSGLLVTLGLFGMVKKTGRFNLPLYLVHRLLRLWPPVALTVVLVATVSGLVVSGPYAEQYWSSIVKGCRDFWWIDITLVTNLVYPYLDQIPRDEGEAASCLPHIWYLGVDTQLYLIMPLILLPLIWWPRKGMAWLGLWTAASVITPAAIIGAYHLWPSSLMVIDPPASLEYNYKVYLMPWCRAGPYLAGVWAGYLLHYGRKHPSITHLKLWQQVLGWAAAVGVALAVLFGIARYNYVGTPSQVPQMSLAEAVMYGGAHRAAWGAAVAWVIVACSWGYGGPVAWFLEHPFWQPLSRLSYCIYLTSLPIQYILIFCLSRPTFYSIYNKIQETAGVMVVVVVVSIFVSLIAESPILRLEKMLLQKSTGRDQAPPEAATPPSAAAAQRHENNLDNVNNLPSGNN